MEYRKKLKTRLYVAIAYIIIGIVMASVAVITKSSNNFFISYGIALTVVGILRIRNHIRLTSSEENIRRQQIAESDERNISIMHRAQSWAYSIYIMMVGVAVIVFELLGEEKLGFMAAMSVCLLLMIYCISYRIISKDM